MYRLPSASPYARKVRVALPGGAFGGADIAVGCMPGYLGPRLPKLDWRAAHSSPLLLHDACEARPSLAQTVPVPRPIDPAAVV